MKDIFKIAGFKYIGPGGILCPCCDRKLSHKRKSKVSRNLFSRLRRSILKQNLHKDLEND